MPAWKRIATLDEGGGDEGKRSAVDAFSPGPVFLGYAVIGVIAFVFVRLFVTETKGRSLEQIETELRARAAPAG